MFTPTDARKSNVPQSHIPRVNQPGTTATDATGAPSRSRLARFCIATANVIGSPWTQILGFVLIVLAFVATGTGIGAPAAPFLAAAGLALFLSSTVVFLILYFPWSDNDGGPNRSGASPTGERRFPITEPRAQVADLGAEGELGSETGIRYPLTEPPEYYASDRAKDRAIYPDADPYKRRYPITEPRGKVADIDGDSVLSSDTSSSCALAKPVPYDGKPDIGTDSDDDNYGDSGVDSDYCPDPHRYFGT